MYVFLLLIGILHMANGQNYTCTATGRFRYKDASCRSYYLCMPATNGFVKSNYTCPSTMIFNPTTQKCSSTATCIDNICDNLPIFPPLFPKIPDPNGPDCKTYILCAGLFNRYPIIQRCDFGYFDNNLNPEPGCWLEPNCSV